MTLISPGDCTLQCGMWLWNHDSEIEHLHHHLTRLRNIWDPTSFNCLSLACKACDYVYIDYVRRSGSSSCRLLRPINCQTFITLHYIIRGSGITCHRIRPNVRHIGIPHLFRFRPYHRSRHVILHQSAKFYPNRTTRGRKKWRQPSWILGVQ